MKRLPFPALGPVAAALLLCVAAPVHATGNNCSFQASGLSMGFGRLDPSAATNVTRAVSAATLNANKWGDCAPGQGLTLSADNGLNFNGTRRMKSASGGFIAYSLTALPAAVPGPGNGNYAVFTFNGVVLGIDYANAPAGSYSDTVIISVSP
jgi:spore coat protein U-like protein